MLLSFLDLRIYSSTNRAQLVDASRLKILLLTFEKFMKNLAVPFACGCHSFYAITGCGTIGYLFSVSKRVESERTSSGITPFNMIVSWVRFI